MPAVLRLLDSGHGGIRTGIVDNDRSGFARDRGFEKLSLLHRIVVVNQDERFVAERFRLLLGRVGEGLEERVLRRRHDDRHKLLFRGERGGN